MAESITLVICGTKFVVAKNILSRSDFFNPRKRKAFFGVATPLSSETKVGVQLYV